MSHWTLEHGYRMLRDHLIEIYTPFYAMNDRAHQITHVISVCDLAVEINDSLELSLSNSILVGAALTHDLFNNNRELHHELALSYLKNNGIDWLDEFSTEDRRLMAHAAGEHRASFKGTYTSLYSEVIAAADRGAPNVRSAIIRCAMYGVDKLGFRGEKLYTHVISHMKDKFGVNGYATYPELYTEFFGDRLVEYRKYLDNVTKEIIDDVVGSHPISVSFAE